MQVLIVEDEKRLAKAIGQILVEQKYKTDITYDGREGVEYGLSGIYDVIVLDLMLPYKDGFQVAAELRQAKIQTPILMLTAKDTVSDKVRGLDTGADDYMTKPFAPEELLARIRALTRRQGEVILDEMIFADMTYNISYCELHKGSKSVHLNYKESELLKLFMAQPEVILSKELLITKVWGYDSEAGDNNVEAYISFLRRKLKFVGVLAEITSIKKQGYRLEKKND